MDAFTLPDHGLIRVADVMREGANDRSLRTAASAGTAIRLARGCYVRTATWSEMSPDQQYLLRIQATAATLSEGAVFSHYSAAAIWGYSIVGPWPLQAHVSVGSASGMRSSRHIRRHVVTVPDNERELVDGLLVTNPLRTLCDLARTMTFPSAVVMFDAGLRASAPARPQGDPLQREQILERLAQDAGRRGIRVATSAAHFARAGAHTAGESLSRVMIHRLRMPEPQLQVPVRDAQGRLHHTDFGWEHALGEFDGRFKYSRDEYTQGRPPEEVVWAEKLREDAIRQASGKTMVRWVWNHLQDLASFERLLRGAGIHPVSAR
ncbi:type IV toxin-antitoxin system AbiEi family antitoxin domain-containing protein [Homoserinimonas sp. OAct 916]|uniref:type IV toxin-antitoxin system AbiEi family antitoxin domain-containing protein n=1 Tax=Homoserinimonas sp. OAct 916 TaxID=2211450 RepID=UPI000DBE1B90|nr:type IV toxin-antitoxin system AbiEi family antitoxin domain-containing protein [Homoserinimonas sp. OAct 916]